MSPKNGIRRLLLSAVAVTTLAACASPTPAADRVVYETAQPVTIPWREGPMAPPRDDVPESARREWIERSRPARAVVRYEAAERDDSDDRPARREVVVRERVRYVESEPRYAWPLYLSWGYYRGYHSHHGRRGFGWGLGWGGPLWCW